MGEFMETCQCGRAHRSSVKRVIAESGAINALPEQIRLLGGKKVFILADENTYSAAGEKVTDVLKKSGVSYSLRVLSGRLAPDEKTVGSAFMLFDSDCDVIVGVGSGVINDTCKLLGVKTGKPYIIIATAPSMDGYASATSSMDVDGVKTSLQTKCPDVIIGDTDVLKNAPVRSLQAGLGDMLAKYVAICEWRIANLVTGEYYCENVASLVRSALKKCADNADGLLKRDETAVKAVFDGLTLSGMAMEYAGVSRPASGAEHSMSHVFDMRALEFGTGGDLHGIQCAVCTLYVVRAYEQLSAMPFDEKRAIKHAENFDLDGWREKLTAFIGKGAKAMIELDKKERKYDRAKHAERLKNIIGNKDEILKIVKEELPDSAYILSLLKKIGAPVCCEDIGIEKAVLPTVFAAAKDIRDKYILPRLCWDLGVIDDIRF